MNTFVLDGITVPTQSILDFNQSYLDDGSYTDHIMMNGSAVRQENFSKIKTVLSGSGWVPSGLHGIDYKYPMLMKCAASRPASSLSNVIVIPAERRSDAGFEPSAYALVNGERVQTGISIVTNTATAVVVSGATQYEIEYYPEIMVLARLVESSVDVSSVNYSWRIEARQAT